MASVTKRTSKVEDRLVVLERAIEVFRDRFRQLEVAVLGIDDVKSTIAARDVVNLEVEDKLTRMEMQMGELASNLEILKVKFEDFDKQWPALGAKADEGFSVVGGKKMDRGKGEKKVPVASACPDPTKKFSYKLQNSKQNVLVTGDSLARGMGYKLKEQCGNMVDVRAFGGAKLGRITDNIVHLSKDENRQLVVVAGANSIEEPTTDLIGNFEEIIDAGKDNSNEVVIVGLIRRYDAGSSFESKRIVVNAKLKELCRVRQVKFVEYEPERSRVHRDGLHLNFWGQNELGKRVFDVLKPFLV